MKLSAWFPVTLSLLSFATSMTVLYAGKEFAPLNLVALPLAIAGVTLALIRGRRVRRTIKLRVAMAEEHVAGWRGRFAEIQDSNLGWEEMERKISELMAEDKKFWDNLPRLDVL